MTRRIQLLLLAFSLISLQSLGQSAPFGVRVRLQSYLDSAVQVTGAPGATLTVFRVGQWRRTWASGNARLQPNEAMQVTNKLRVSSITANMASTAILKLASDGQLNLNDTIGRWLPARISQLIPFRESITIRHLMRHTSGMADYISDTASRIVQTVLANPTRYFSADEIMTTYFTRLQPAGLPSARTHRYCNTGLLLLGRIIDSASGQPYKFYIQNEILSPLNLTSTYFPDSNDNTLTTPFMRGYYAVGVGQFADFTNVNPSWTGLAAEAISTTDELVTYYKALQEGQLIPQAWVDSMHVFDRVSPNYGYGGYRIRINSNEWWGQGGRLLGYNCNLYYCPQLDTYVSMAINVDNAIPDLFLGGIDKYLMQISTPVGIATAEKGAKAIALPQPAKDVIALELSDKAPIVELSIHNLTGAKVASYKAYVSGTPLDIHTLPNGLYFFRYETPQGSNVVKFVKA